MSARRLALAMERERLVARSERLRERVAAQAAALTPALDFGDRVRDGVRWVHGHPALVASALAVVAIVRPRVVWRWGLRAWSVWKLVGRWRRRTANLSRN